jgi:hypothetical protein
VIAIGELTVLTVKVSGCVAVFELESVTLTTTLTLPVDGVPEITPPDDRLTPVGSAGDPAFSAQV